jgi:UDP-glucose 4-epimerase
MILITGSAGYIGSQICKKFEKSRIKYIGIDNLKYAYEKNIFNKKKFVKCCISNKKKISSLIINNKIHTIIHAAAYAYVNDAEKNKKNYRLNNIVKTKKFIDTVSELKIKNFIFLSSSNVYSENKNRYSENDHTNPKNYYGKTKLAIEKFLLDNKNIFHNLIILRLFNVVGLTKKFTPMNFGDLKYQRLLFKVFYKLKKKSYIELNYLNIKKDKMIFPSRDFIDIRDFLRLIIKINKSFLKENKKKIYNVGCGISYQLNDVIKKIKSKSKLIISYKKNHKKEYEHTKANITKVKNDFNWSPQKKIKETLNSYRKNLVLKY